MAYYKAEILRKKCFSVDNACIETCLTPVQCFLRVMLLFTIDKFLFADFRSSQRYGVKMCDHGFCVNERHHMHAV